MIPFYQIIKNNIYIYISFQFLFCQVMLPSSDLEGWTTLQDETIWVGYKYVNDLPWCRSESILPYSMQQIISIVGNFNIYDKVFSRITTSNVIDENKNIVYLKIDMPVFNDRDYIVEYKTFKDNEDILYQWYSIKDSNIPEYNNIVRLNRAAGEWRLSQISATETKVSYTWNGELLGNFPSFYLTTAWGTQGLEIIDWLEEALDN
jgi:ribosome-associated toxin RatA of RatAB toxin-antitoxin module